MNKDKNYTDLTTPVVITGFANISRPDQDSKFNLVAFTNDKDFIDEVEKVHQDNLEFTKGSGFEAKYHPIGDPRPKDPQEIQNGGYKRLNLKSFRAPSIYDSAGNTVNLNNNIPHGSKVRVKILAASYANAKAGIRGTSLYFTEVQIVELAEQKGNIGASSKGFSAVEGGTFVGNDNAVNELF